MGIYVNPSNETKEDWLRRVALHIKPHEAREVLMRRRTDRRVPVCLVDNGAFTAAGVCYTEREIDVWQHSEDERPKSWYSVPFDALADVISSRHWEYLSREYVT